MLSDADFDKKQYTTFHKIVRAEDYGVFMVFCFRGIIPVVWGEWLSGLYSFYQVTEAKLGRMRSPNSGWMTCRRPYLATHFAVICERDVELGLPCQVAACIVGLA